MKNTQYPGRTELIVCTLLFSIHIKYAPIDARTDGGGANIRPRTRRFFVDSGKTAAQPRLAAPHFFILCTHYVQVVNSYL